MKTRKTRSLSVIVALGLTVSVPRNGNADGCVGEVLPPPAGSVLKCGPHLGVFLPEETYRVLREKELEAVKIPLLEAENAALKDANKFHKEVREPSLITKPIFWVAVLGALGAGLVLGYSFANQQTALTVVR